LGKPFLQHQLEFLKSSGINRLLFLVGYLGDCIEGYFGDGSKYGVEINYVYEKKLLGTGGALKNAGSKLDKEFLLLNGDTFLPVDYNKFIEYFKQRNKIAAIVAYDNSLKIAPNNLEIRGQEDVVGYNKQDSGKMTHLDSGALLFKREVLGLIPEGAVCSLEEEVFPRLIEKKEMAAFLSNQRFYDMGSPEGLEILKAKLNDYSKDSF
jgi:NDP-sugar pyrophosphorylase family protein